MVNLVLFHMLHLMEYKSLKEIWGFDSICVLGHWIGKQCNVISGNIKVAFSITACSDRQICWYYS